MSIKIEIPAGYGHSDEELSFIREMGVNYLNLNVMPPHVNYDDMMAEAQRLAKYDLYISDFACPPLQKNADIILGTSARDDEIDKFISFVKLAHAIGAPLVSVAWQPNGIFRTGCCAGKHTRGGASFFVNMDEINARPISNGRVYTKDEIWGNFEYFLERVIPVCEENNVRMALHPNDPPVPSLGGVPSLIYNTDCYKRALSLAKGSTALTVKMCVGCWLENAQFGDLMQDIGDFNKSGQLSEVHFRNVSAPLPNFEETLCEDGYADMYAILKRFVNSGFDGYMSIDHAFHGYKSTGGRLASLAYPTGYLKGMLHAAEKEIK